MVEYTFYMYTISYLSILFTASHILNLSQSYHDIVAFIHDFYLWVCIYVFFISIYFTL